MQNYCITGHIYTIVYYAPLDHPIISIVDRISKPKNRPTGRFVTTVYHSIAVVYQIPQHHCGLMWEPHSSTVGYCGIGSSYHIYHR